jgi:hypothetical protein
VEKSSRSFHLCAATNGRSGDFEACFASVVSTLAPPLSRSIARVPAHVAIRVFSPIRPFSRCFRESASRRIDADVSVIDAAAQPAPERRQKKMRKVVDTKKMRG